MRIPILVLSTASLIAVGGIAKADDHLFTPEIATGDHRPANFFDNLHDSPGQGVPFVGGDTSVPATAVREDDPKTQDFPGVGADAAPNAAKFK